MGKYDEFYKKLLGTARQAFQRKVDQRQKPKAVEIPRVQSAGSGMVKADAPKLEGPKPQGQYRYPIMRQAHIQNLAREADAAQKLAPEIPRTPPKPVVDSKYLEQGKRLQEKFQQAARADKERGRD